MACTSITSATFARIYSARTALGLARTIQGFRFAFTAAKHKIVHGKIEKTVEIDVAMTVKMIVAETIDAIGTIVATTTVDVTTVINPKVLASGAARHHMQAISRG